LGSKNENLEKVESRFYFSKKVWGGKKVESTFYFSKKVGGGNFLAAGFSK